MTVREAAEALGVTVEAVRGRMYRGRYGKVKDDEGRVFVLLPADQLPNGRPEVHQRSSERSRSSSGKRSRTDGTTVYRRLDAADAELVEELRGEVAYLKEVVATRDDELRRKDTIIMQMAQRIPELEAAQTGREDPQEPRNGDGVVEHEERDGGPEKRSWWRRVFG